MRLTTRLSLSLLALTACVPESPRRNGRDTTDGSCDLDTAKVVEKNYTFRSDAEIDDETLPSGCWDLHGTLKLESASITSLAKLGKLAAVTNLELSNTKLTELDFVEPVTVYENLDIRNNSSLAKLDNLVIDQDRLLRATIQDNGALTSLDGLVDLTAVEGGKDAAGNDIPGDLVIRGNAKLASIGLTSLTDVNGKLEISDNGALTTLDGLSDLATVGGDLTISGNAKLTSAKLSRLTTITGSTRISSNAALTAIDIASLETVKRLEISDNQALTSFSGVRAHQIGGDLMVRGNPKLASLGSMFSLDSITGHVTIDNNAALSNLGAFTLTLRNIVGTLSVSNNPQLTDLGSLSHLNAIASTVAITNNTKLPYCKALEIDHCVSSGTVSIVGVLGAPTTNCDCWCD